MIHKGAAHAVLIVEDERIVAKDLQQSLVGMGYDAFAIAASADEALSHASARCPDVVLMDIRIKGRRDGIETAALLRERFSVPVVYLTAHADDATLERAKLTEPYGYLIKPIQTAELRSAIEISIHKHGIASRLRASERWFATTLRSIANAVITVDPAGNVSFMNAAGERLTGWTTARALGRPVREVIGVLDPAHPAAPLDIALSPEQPPGEPTWREHATADRRIISETASRVTDGGDVLGAVMVFRDVTEERRAQDALRSLNVELEDRVVERTQQLEAANRELQAFSYSVAHDLRSPLRAINAFSQLLLEGHAESLAPEAGRYLHKIRGSTERMAQLIDDLLRLAHVARSRLEVRDVDLSSLGRSVVAVLREPVTDRDVTITIADGLVVRGDEHLLRIVLENLLGNAWKYTAKTAAAVIELGSERQGQGLVYFVRDNGVGFDMQYASRIFVAFERLHSGADFEGQGIGLTLAERIIHRHGGRIWAEAAPSHGATLYFVV